MSNIENVWVTTKAIKENGFGFDIPKGRFVTWNPKGSEVTDLCFERETANVYRDAGLFRKPTVQELKYLESLMGYKPIYKLVSIRNSHTTIGSDPEIFVVDEQNHVIPAFRFLEAKSSAQKLIEPSWNFRSINNPPYWDGFQAEFVLPIGCCMASWVDCVQAQLGWLQTQARNHNPHARLTGESVLPVPSEELEKGEKIHVELGCMPSLNAYGDHGKDAGNGRTLPIRFAGCHIHLGVGQPDALPEMIKTIDAIAGVASVSILEGLEDPRRRKYYGLAGEYRMPKYGLEYRTLSSAILWHPGLFHIHCNLVRWAATMYKYRTRWQASEHEVRQAINTLDVDLARAILVRNRQTLEEAAFALWNDLKQPFRLGEEITDPPSPKRIVDEFFLTGVRKFIDLDIEANWHLSDGEWKEHSEGPECNGWRSLRAWLGGEEGRKSC